VDPRSTTNVEFEVKEPPLATLDEEAANDESPIVDASDFSPPAAAIIWGLSGLVELAKLPFLECCMPWTILVCR
jgi:hypothetical protein